MTRMKQELLNIWLFYLVAAAPLSVLVAFLGRRRTEWKLWEASVFVVPFSVWFLCCLCHLLLFPLSENKGILQPFVESFVLGLGVPILSLVRVIVGRKQAAWPFSGFLIVGLSAVGIAVALCVPRFMTVD
jgi:hypothetical protein